jgi:hypothetical protein
MRRIEAFSVAVIVVFLALPVPGRGQGKEAPEKTAAAQKIHKVIQLKYADPDNILNLLFYFGAELREDRRMKILTVVGLPAQVEAIEEALRKLDVPPPPTKDAEITAYLLLATRQAVQTTLPSELDEVVEQLRRVLKYQHFGLLNTTLLRARDGDGASVSGVASASGGEGQKADFHFGFTRAEITADGKPRSIRLNGFDFVMERPGEAKEGQTTSLLPRTTSAKIHTDIDVPEGQRVVVGKTSFESPDDALVLVLTAKVLD